MSTTKPASNSSPATTDAHSAPLNAKRVAAVPPVPGVLEAPDGWRWFQPLLLHKPANVAHDRPNTWEFVHWPNKDGYLCLGTPTGNAKG